MHALDGEASDPPAGRPVSTGMRIGEGGPGMTASKDEPRRSEREREEWEGPAAAEPDGEDGETAESEVDPGRGRGQVDKSGHVPGREAGERPQDRGTYADAGSRDASR